MERTSVDAIDFLNWLFRLDPRERPTLEQVLDHRYFKIDLTKVKKLS